jgi:Plasmid replication region DNA-binding N-term
MPNLPLNSYGAPNRGISQSDVSHAADTLLRSGDRPTEAKIRARLGRGSPNTIYRYLDAWWKTLSARLDSGPAALHRLPETVAHIAEALWMQALEEARKRTHMELNRAERSSTDFQQNLEVRSHVLSLREGELDSRLRDRDAAIEQLCLQLREVTLALRKQQAFNNLQTRNLASLKEKLSVNPPTPKFTAASKSVRQTKAASQKHRGVKRALKRKTPRKAKRGSHHREPNT